MNDKINFDTAIKRVYFWVMESGNDSNGPNFLNSSIIVQLLLNLPLAVDMANSIPNSLHSIAIKLD